jgi:hypothetical protein
MPVAKKEDAMLLLAVLCVFGVIAVMTDLLRRGYDPMRWGMHLSVLAMGTAIINRPWVRAWMRSLEPEASLTPTLNPRDIPWGDISMVLLMLSLLCYALWIVQACHDKEEPPIEDK